MAKPKKKTEDEILQEAMERTANDAQMSDDDSGEDEYEVEAAAPVPARSKAKAPAKPGKIHTVTYIPLDAEDQSSVIFHHMRFQANLPRETANPELIALARQNPWFSVDGAPPPKRVKPPKRDTDGLEARSGLPAGLKVENEVEAEDVV